jgi:glycosyltransferase involved in cell wall biosynthesis
MKFNLHIYPTPFLFESRILRETNSLIKLKLVDKIHIVSTWNDNLLESEQIDSNRLVIRFKFNVGINHNSLISKILNYILFYFYVLKHYYAANITVINCHSLLILPIGVILKIIKPKTILIYDAHELETHRTGMSNFFVFVSILLEKILIKWVDKTIVVSPSIQEFYKNKYPFKNVYLLRNIPQKIMSSFRNQVFNKKFSIELDDIIFIYQGILNYGRGVEFLCQTFQNVSKKKHIVFMGYGPLEAYVKSYSTNNINIHFMPAVKPSEIAHYTSGADIGICLIENVSLSYYFSLPNKFFEYIHSGLPVISSNFPDMKELVCEYNVGWVVDINREKILELINDIEVKHINEKRQNTSIMQDILNWENESQILKTIYNYDKN